MDVKFSFFFVFVNLCNKANDNDADQVPDSSFNIFKL